LLVLAIVLVIPVIVFLTPRAAAAGNEKYEVWAIDQSDSPGLSYGGTLYIWDGHDLERGRGAAAVPRRIDLGGAVAAMCLARTGATPVRPHMLAINRSQTHAIISFVASGHVVVLDADSAAPVDCIRTSVGAGGARQVHFAIPSLDESYIVVEPEREAARADQHRLRNEHVRARHLSGHQPRHLHHPERRPMRESRAPPGQRADLSRDRIDQPVHVRHPEGRWAVRG
jgi:hypothetical protein